MPVEHVFTSNRPQTTRAQLASKNAWEGTNAHYLSTFNFQGRISLDSSDPEPSSDLIDKTTGYIIPYNGQIACLWNGTRYNDIVIPIIPFSIPAVANTNYDVWATYQGIVTLIAWLNDTTRATNYVLTNGLPLQVGDQTQILVGTIRTNVNGKGEDSVANRFVSNWFNEKPRPLRSVTADVIWTYSTDAWQQANTKISNQLNFVNCKSRSVKAICMGTGVNDSSAGRSAIGIGLDSSTVDSSLQGTKVPGFILNLGIQLPFIVTYNDYPGIGYHSLRYLERGNGTGTNTWVGRTTEIQAGLTGEMYG